jgi:chemosensory pili system protein ChpA (sensor histidine kinase/response regulator)
MLFGNGKKRILVADKSKGFLNAARSLLEDAGFWVNTTKNGKEALGQIKEFKYDLLVLGVLMPRIDGIRLLEIARKSRIYANVPVLFVSDYLSKEELTIRQEEMAGRTQGHIQKPFVTKAFLKMVAALLERNGIVLEQHV